MPHLVFRKYGQIITQTKDLDAIPLKGDFVTVDESGKAFVVSTITHNTWAGVVYVDVNDPRPNR